MKKLLVGSGAILLAVLLISGAMGSFNSTAFAFEAGGCPAFAGHGCWHHRGGYWRCRHRLGKMLKLTDKQKKEMFSIRLDERAKMKPLFKSLKVGREQLIALVMSGKFDEAKAQSIANEQATVMSKLIVEKTRMFSKMYALLTPEQRTKLDQLREKWKAHHPKEHMQKN